MLSCLNMLVCLFQMVQHLHSHAQMILHVLRIYTVTTPHKLYELRDDYAVVYDFQAATEATLTLTSNITLIYALQVRLRFALPATLLSK